jgi:tRNA-specific 2-thiouridylase
MAGLRVAVAMSGGVDSSVAAALLVEDGYEVVGLTMQLWPREEPDTAPGGRQACCGLEAIDSARRVADSLGIRHYVINMREEFEQLVIEPFCEEYAQGRTPNPCIRCNTFVKFGPLLQRAREIGATKLATGHYARIMFHVEYARWQLLRGADTRKDQSYYLYGMTQEHLAQTLFPLGELTKVEVRRKAKELKLPAAHREESQEVCFITQGDYRDYLAQRRPEVLLPGPIVDGQDRELGQHRGLAFYTIGQREGLGLQVGIPMYVVRLEPEANRLVVGTAEELFAKGMWLREVNPVAWPEVPAAGAQVEVMIRSTGKAVPATILPEGGRVKVLFNEPVRAVTPGQAGVCYDKDTVVCGGTIASPF